MNESFMKNDILWLGEEEMGKKGKVINRKRDNWIRIMGNKKIKGGIKEGEEKRESERYLS